jgi:hypothetical protein
MHSYVGSLWVSAVCAVVLSGAPSVAVAHEVNPSSGSSGTTPSLMAMITPAAVSVTRAFACNSADQYTQCISLSPSQGPAGAKVKVNGTGWHDHAIRRLDVPINIGMTKVAHAHPSADGTFSVGMTIPTSTPEGELEVDAIIGNGGSASARYTVTGGGSPSGQQQTQPSVAFNPPEGPPGTPTTAHGHGFVPNQSVKVTQAGGLGVTGGGGTVQADQSGSINMGFRIADKTPEGVITVAFAQGARIATAQFRVTPLSASTFSPSLALPFTAGETWYVCQGYKGTISHQNVYALDLTIRKDDVGSTGCYGNVNGSTSRAVLAPGGGSSIPIGSDLICINLDNGRSMLLGHLTNRLTGRVSQGAVIGKVAAANPASANGGYAHIHVQIHLNSGCAGGGPTVPFDDAHQTRFMGAPNLPDVGGVNQHRGAALMKPN